MNDESRPATRVAIGRGLLGRCPRCGRSRLFRAYLKPVERCAACAEAFGHIRADDGPAWLTVLVVGHLVVPLAYAVERLWAWPMPVTVAAWSSLSLALVLALLPVAKGLFVALLWAKKAPGSERP